MFKYIAIPIGMLIMIATFNLSNATDTNNFYDISFNTIDGNKIYLSDFRNKAFVITNTASFCGFTRQFDGFQSIWDKYRNDGLVVIGVPSNDFNQEAKTNAEVKTLCETNFSVDFILAGRKSAELVEMYCHFFMCMRYIGYIQRYRIGYKGSSENPLKRNR